MKKKKITKHITKKKPVVKKVKKKNKKKFGKTLPTYCFVFISEFDNEYDGSTILAPSRQDAVNLLSRKIHWVETEWIVHEVIIPPEGIIIESSIPSDKSY